MGRQLPAEERSKNSPSCMFGRFVPLYSFIVFLCLFKAQISEGYTYRNIFCDYLYYVYTDCLYSI